MSNPVCILVDGDNISRKYAPQILATAKALGTPNIPRVYLNAQKPSDWDTAAGFKLIHAGTGKNAADVLIAIEAMEMALVDHTRHFVIASSDGDFSHIAMRLRELGATIHGVGEVKAPQSFRAFCHAFTEVGIAKPASAPKPAAAKVPELDRQIQQVIAAKSDGNKGARITDVSLQMRQLHNFQIGTHPDKNWRSYLSKRPELFAIDPKGPDARVRYIPKGFIHAA